MGHYPIFSRILSIWDCTIKYHAKSSSHELFFYLAIHNQKGLPTCAPHDGILILEIADLLLSDLLKEAVKRLNERYSAYSWAIDTQQIASSTQRQMQSKIQFIDDIM